LPNCQHIQAASVLSPNGRHFAAFSQTVCEDPSQTGGQVLVGTVDKTVQMLAYDVQGTSDVDLTWNGDMELQVVLPKAASMKRYNMGNALPRVVEVRKP
jgi:hypothetical protein